jgi:hypothetical protein
MRKHCFFCEQTLAARDRKKTFAPLSRGFAR